MSDIARKILAIIAKAESTSSKDEGETFLAKAHKLMQENNLSMLDLGTLEEDAIDGDIDAGAWYGGYYGAVIAQLAQYYGCIVVTRYEGRKSLWSIFGRESARVTTSLMLPYVFREIRRQAIAAHKLGEYSSASVGITRIGNALAVRIARMCKMNERQHSAETHNALVPVDRIELAIKTAFPKATTSAAKEIRYDRNAMSRASGINLNLQTGPADESRMVK